MPPTGAGALDYVFDPRDPAPTRGGAISSGEPVMRAGAFDQSEAATRPDVLVFATPPLDDDLEIVGPVTAQLWIASDAPDTDFTARLIDLYPPSADYPDGFAMNLTEGLLRVRYRDSWEKPVADDARARSMRSRSSCSRWQTCSAAATGCGSTFRAATSRIST